MIRYHLKGRRDVTPGAGLHPEYKPDDKFFDAPDDSTAIATIANEEPYKSMVFKELFKGDRRIYPV